MLKIFAIAWNVIRQEFSERSTLIFFLILPLIFTFIIGMGLGGSSNRFADGDARLVVGIVDLDASDLSADLFAALESSEFVQPEMTTLDKAQEALDSQDIPMYLMIPPGFEQDLLSGASTSLRIQQAPSGDAIAAGQAVRTAVRQISGTVASARTSVIEREKISPFSSDSEKETYFQESLVMARDMVNNPPARVETSLAVEDPSGQEWTGFNQTSPGQLVTWVLITLLGAAEVFVSERLGGTLRRLLISPSHKLTILAGKVLGWLMMGVTQMVILIGFGALVLKVNWGRSPTALAMIAFAFALAAVSLGVLISTFVKTRSQAGGMVTLAGMMLAALGGAWWPMEITPQIYQTVVKALPTTWAMQGFNDVILRGQGPAGVFFETAVLLGFAVLFFTAASTRLKFE